MAKRSDFKRRAQDAYDTPYDCVIPLLPHLAPGTRFVEPCAGQGDLVRHLEQHGHVCKGAFDIEPRSPDIPQGDALKFIAEKHYNSFDAVISNPPWTRELLHDLIFKFYWQKPTWFLFDAGWAHTVQAKPYMPMLKKIVSVGRVRWIAGTKDKGKDDAAWHLFDGRPSVEFIGR